MPFFLTWEIGCCRGLGFKVQMLACKHSCEGEPFYQIQLLKEDPFTKCLSLYLLSFFIPSVRLPELDGLPEDAFSLNCA